MRFVFAFAKYLKYIFFFILLVLILLLWIINTNPGNNLLFKTLEKIEPKLTISLVEGSLLYSPIFEKIKWQDGETLIEIDELSYKFDWQCIVEEFCLDYLVVKNANINIPESEETAVVEEESTEPFVLEFPIPVHLKKIELNNTDVNVAGTVISLKKLFLSASGVESNLNLDTSINDLTIILPEAKSVENAKSTDDSFKVPKELPPILAENTLPEVQLPFNLIADKINLTNFKLNQGSVNLSTINSLNTKFTYYETKVDIQEFELDVPEADLNLTGNIDLNNRYPMSLTGLINVKDIKELQPTNMLKGQKIQLNTNGNLGDLKTNIKFSNLIEATLDNHIDLYSKNLPHDIKLEWKNFKWPLTGDSQINSSQGQFSSHGNLADYKLSANTQYEIPELPIGQINLDGVGNLQSLSLNQLLLSTLEGNISLAGKLSWVDSIKWLGDLNINNINFTELNETYPALLNGTIKQSVTIPLNKKANQSAWKFDLPDINLNGSFLDKPLSIKGQAKGDEKTGFIVNNLNIINDVNSVLINGKVTDKSDLILDLNIQDLSKIIVDSIGQINGKVALTGSLENLKVDSTLSAKNINYLNNFIESVNLSGNVLLSDLPIAALNLDAKNIKASGQNIKGLSLDIYPNETATDEVKHNINLSLLSDQVSSDLSLIFTQQLTTWQAQLTKGLINTEQGILKLKSPFITSMNNETINITEHCWLITDTLQADNGQLCVKQFDAGDNGDIKVQVNKFLLSALSPLIPETLVLEGDLQADVQINWKNNEKPNLALLIEGNNTALNIKQNQPEQKEQQKLIHYPVDKFKIEVSADQSIAKFSLLASSDKLLNANVEGHINPYQTEPEVIADVKLLVPSFENFAVLIPQVDKLAGHLQADLSINGKLDKPSIQGQILIADTTVLAPGTPVKISDLHSQIDIDNNVAKITGYLFTNKKQKTSNKDSSILDSIVKLKDKTINTVNIPQRIANQQKIPKTDAQANGRVDLSGMVDWAAGFKADLHIEAQQMKIEDYGKIALLVSPNINIVYDQSLAVDGIIKVDKGNITVKDLPEGAVNVSNDVIVVDAKAKESATNLPMKLNVKIELGKELRLKALGLDTFVHGTLLAKQELEKDLTVNGELTFSEGKYQSLGQQLVLQNSRILFQGQPGSPYLNIEAIRDPKQIDDDVVAGVRVTGTPDQLKLVIFSEPAMSQQNALSYITSGQSIENSDGNGGQLASLLISLSAGQTNGTLNSVGDKVGIKDLSLASSGHGDQQSVGLKGTIAPGVEVSYGVGVFDSFTIFAIRYELFKKFYVEASSGLYQAVDVYYEWDWD